MSEKATCPCPCGKTDNKTCAAAAKNSAAQNGKGDSPRNISTKFRKNYDAISWAFKPGKAKTGKKFVKTY